MYENGAIVSKDFQKPTVEQFRFMFNSHITLMGIDAICVMLYDPDDKLNPKIAKICYANYTPCSYDKRIIDYCTWRIEFGEKLLDPKVRLVAEIHLKSENK